MNSITRLPPLPVYPRPTQTPPRSFSMTSPPLPTQIPSSIAPPLPPQTPSSSTSSSRSLPTSISLPIRLSAIREGERYDVVRHAPDTDEVLPETKVAFERKASLPREVDPIENSQPLSIENPQMVVVLPTYALVTDPCELNCRVLFCTSPMRKFCCVLTAAGIAVSIIAAKYVFKAF